MNKQYFNKENTIIRLLITIGIGLIGTVIFVFTHMPIPWLLGPMTAVLIGSRFAKIELYWSSYIRDTGLTLVGYSIGLSFTKDALIQIIHQLPSMLFMTVILVSFCACIALLVSKLSGIDYATILTGSIPGGLSQIITLAEEIKDIDVTVVTFLQVARLIMIIFFVPLLIFSPMFGVGKPVSSSDVHTAAAQWGTLFPNIILFAAMSLLCIILGKKLKLPTPYLLGPIIATAVLNISGFHGPALPASILDISQFMIGGYIGLLLKPEKLHHKVKIISLAAISGFVMIMGSLGLSLLLMIMHNISSATSFLSVAPGGMDQMGIIAHEVHADLSVVTGYQLFRLFFIYFAIPPLLKWYFKYRIRKKTAVL
jgi:membrane AbrB-like protein